MHVNIGRLRGPTRKSVTSSSSSSVGFQSKQSTTLLLPGTSLGKSKNAPSKCKPEHHVVFLKTHKCGSSTVTNILSRYVDNNNLTMLLPRDIGKDRQFKWPNRFRISNARVDRGRMPNMLANHARFDRKPMKHLFPRSKSKYVTILRDPVTQWESMSTYYKFPRLLNMTQLHINDTVGYFFSNPPSIDWINQASRSRTIAFFLLKNPQSFDLGFDNTGDTDSNGTQEKIKTVERNFDLVLIMEHFEESITLLKRRMCWGA